MYVGRYIFLIIDPCVLAVAVGWPYLRFKTSKLEIVFTILFRLQSSIARRFRLRPCSYLNLHCNKNTTCLTKIGKNCRGFRSLLEVDSQYLEVE